MRFIELFAGIGGFRYGLERCNVGRSGTCHEGGRDTSNNGDGGESECGGGGPERSVAACVGAGVIEKDACADCRRQ